MRLSAFCRQAHFAFYRRFFKNFALFLAKQKVACIIPRKGEVLPPFGRKEVNTMTPNRREFEKQCAFQKFCKSVLHNEACNTHEEIRRRRVREVTFSNLALHEERQLYTVDKYFQDEKAEPSYQMAGKEITPKLLLEAIRALPEERRKIVLLYYFEPTEYPENALVPYPVILAASKGDPDAMKIVLQHFSGYIASLSMRKLYDERGNVYFGVDEEIRERLQAKLMRAILTFRAE